ncbi:MAG: hypothetical protein EBS82_02255 [Methylocystaceae bacterium]|nr:hypothetical protein [Methylocystaceae bacterium]NBT22865.1 hypothetical protein [Methylocystaceae bacterium]
MVLLFRETPAQHMFFFHAWPFSGVENMPLCRALALIIASRAGVLMIGRVFAKLGTRCAWAS